ncbi:hypothetical protein G6F22_021906 [Rhizopus arrhizus]|nr:hypothetical protein G6F22_021906 [Rhizopus arrhizus]KAG1248388.1 hypothetical protein G6F66_015509 [Rhizopus arrhizus]
MQGHSHGKHRRRRPAWLDRQQAPDRPGHRHRQGRRGAARQHVWHRDRVLHARQRDLRVHPRGRSLLRHRWHRAMEARIRFRQRLRTRHAAAALRRH